MILFPRFLEDTTEYGKAEQYWIELWRHIEGTFEWTTPWLKTQFANGDPFYDGNPIFSAFSLQRQRGVRVVQLDAESDDEPFSCWVEAAEAPKGEPLDSLVLCCGLTDHTAIRATQMLAGWVAGKELNLPSGA